MTATEFTVVKIFVIPYNIYKIKLNVSNILRHMMGHGKYNDIIQFEFKSSLFDILVHR